MKFRYFLILLLLMQKFNIYPSDENLDPSLFKNIKIKQNQALDEIKFWVPQASEHAFFIYLGIVEKNFKKQALVIHNKFENFRKKLASKKSKQNLTSIFSLINELINLQNAILAEMKRDWVGWLFASLLKHMIMEQKYFVKKLNGLIKPEDEMEFWNKEAQDRVATIAHLLDPSEKSWVKEANNIIDKYFNVPKEDKEEFNKSVLDSIKQVNTFSKNIEKSKVESIISKKLADHEAREGKRGQKIIELLNIK